MWRQLQYKNENKIWFKLVYIFKFILNNWYKQTLNHPCSPKKISYQGLVL